MLSRHDQYLLREERRQRAELMGQRTGTIVGIGMLAGLGLGVFYGYAQQCTEYIDLVHAAHQDIIPAVAIGTLNGTTTAAAYAFSVGRRQSPFADVFMASIFSFITGDLVGRIAASLSQEVQGLGEKLV